MLLFFTEFYMGILFGLIITHSVHEVAETQTIHLKNDIDSTNLQVGSVQLKVDGIWKPICRAGSENVWGKKEATVACRQLQFEGGWPYTMKQNDPNDENRHLNNFKCNGPETTLQDCQYKESDSCYDKKLAGVQCYKSYEVQLFGGLVPNAGRVEVRYDDVWSNVCYNSLSSPGRNWNFYKVQVLCRELGFPGTMLQMQGGQGEGTRQSVVNNFRCNSDVDSYRSLQGCFPDAPVLTDNSRTACGHGSSDGGNEAGNEAVAICAVPGYLGCYNSENNRHLETDEFPSQNNMTIDKCRNYCRKNVFRYASLKAGNMCFCANKTANGLPVGDTECKMPCSGDGNQVCGGPNKYSIYDVNLGTCVDPANGDTYRVSGIQCKPEMDIVGETFIQCVLGDLPNETKWSDPVPECKNITMTNGSSKGLLIGVIVASILVIMSFAGLIFYFRRRRCLRLLYIPENIDKIPESTKTDANETSVNNHKLEYGKINNVDVVNESDIRIYHEVQGTGPGTDTNRNNEDAYADVNDALSTVVDTPRMSSSAIEEGGIGASGNKHECTHYQEINSSEIVGERPMPSRITNFTETCDVSNNQANKNYEYAYADFSGSAGGFGR